MNRLEFNEVIKAFGIGKPLSTTTGRYGSIENVHYWGGLAIYFGGSYYTVVNGRIPLEVANIIYGKYPNNPYNIRVDGGSSDWNPVSRAVDDKYEKEIQEYIDMHLDVEDYLELCKKAIKNLKRRTNNNKYLNTYHIDTKEGLLILLTEMKDYYLRKNNKPETEVKKFDDLLAMVSSEILKNVDPSIPAYDWMQGDEENRNTYNLAVERDKNTKLGQMFRTAISDFDKAVNPFINGANTELDDIENYLKRIKIIANKYNSVNGKHRENCCSLIITDSKTGNNTAYYRSPDGFSFKLSYKLGDNEYLDVLHYFTTTGNFESDKGEVIAINYDSDNENIDMRFNITNGKAGKTYEDKTNATTEQIAFVYDKLLEATEYAKSVTIENMKKKGNIRQLK